MTRGAGWTLAAALAQAVIRIGTLAILARLISPVDFGYMAAVLTVITISETITQIGLAPALVQRRDVSREDLVTAQSVAILLSLSAMLLLIAFAPAVAGLYGLPQITPYLRVASLAFLLRGLGALSRARAQRAMNFRRMAKVQTFAALVGYAGTVLPLAGLGFGVWALVFALVAEAFISLAVYSLFDRPIPSFRIHRHSARGLLRFGIGDSLSQIMNKVADQIDYLVVGRLLGAEALGLYSRAFQLFAGQTRRTGQALQTVLFPALASIQDEPERLVEGYRRTLAVVFLSASLMSVFACLLAPHIVLLVLGGQWTDAIAPFAILAVATAPHMGTRINNSLLKATGRIFTVAMLQGTRAIGIGIGAYAGVAFGIAGVALAVTLVVWLHFFLSCAVCLRRLGIPAVTLLRAIQPAATVAGMMIAVLLTAKAVAWQVGLGFWSSGGVMALAGAATGLGLLVLPVGLFGPDGRWLRDYMSRRIFRRRN